MRTTASDFGLPVFAITSALLLFGVFVWFAGINPVEMWLVLFQGAFGSWFSWQNTLQRAAPLMLTALCVAIPARAGLIIIGGEGALVLGGLACAALALCLVPLPANYRRARRCCARRAPWPARLWIMHWPDGLRQYRGINETISSLLLAYIAIGLFKHLVEGLLRDPCESQQACHALAGCRDWAIGGIAGSDVHWGLAVGVLACVALGLWLRATASGLLRFASWAATRARRSWWGCLPTG